MKKNQGKKKKKEKNDYCQLLDHTKSRSYYLFVVARIKTASHTLALSSPTLAIPSISILKDSNFYFYGLTLRKIKTILDWIIYGHVVKKQ